MAEPLACSNQPFVPEVPLPYADKATDAANRRRVQIKNREAKKQWEAKQKESNEGNDLELAGIQSRGTPQFMSPEQVSKVIPAKPAPVEPEPVAPVSQEPAPLEDWRTPVHAKEVGMWIPVKDDNGNPVVSKNGKPAMRPYTMGVRVHMKDGSSWFHRFATKKSPASWTRTIPSSGSKVSSGRMSYPDTLPEAGATKDVSVPHSKLRRDCLENRWPGRKMLDALNWGLDNAEPWLTQD